MFGSDIDESGGGQDIVITAAGGSAVDFVTKYTEVQRTSARMICWQRCGDVGESVGKGGDKMLSVEEGGYALPFEVISMMLLAALVGCIVIAMRSNKTETVQIIS